MPRSSKRAKRLRLLKELMADCLLLRNEREILSDDDSLEDEMDQLVAGCLQTTITNRYTGKRTIRPTNFDMFAANLQVGDNAWLTENEFL